MNDMNHGVNYQDAVDGLARSLESIEARLRTLDEALSGVGEERRAAIQNKATDLLPSIANNILSELRRQVPGFVDQPVREAFANHRKIFGLIPKPGYSRTLAILRTRLASFLDQSGHAILTILDSRIRALTVDKAALSTRQSDTLDLLRSLERSRKSGGQLPPQAIVEINNIASRASAIRTKQQSIYARTAKGTGRANTSSGADSDDSDLWLYMVTDIPTSLRTLQLHFGSSHHAEQSHTAPSERFIGGGGTYDGAGASANFEQEAGWSRETSVIATDDRLGAFS